MPSEERVGEWCEVDVTIADSGLSPDSDLVVEFRHWVELEWGRVDPFSGQGAKLLPAPILALEAGTLVGGLSFTHSVIPGTQQEALWINTLLVAPQCRRKGVGSKLVAAAETAVKSSGTRELYVFTQVAEIYRKLNWRVHSQTSSGTILTKSLHE